MKEIKRIHIAKVQYDVEVGAKKELEDYLRALEAYSHDDIVSEVEIRITEILDDRGVKKAGVITHEDVEALKEQLGKPQEFMDEEDDDVAVGSIDDVTSSRKLFRDTDHAVFGGVLAGLAAFFKVNIAIVRLVFIILAFASFGTALLVYLVLWIAVPPARTAADKLQMMGRSVTVHAIREMNEHDMGRRVSGEHGSRAAFIVMGIASVIAACVAALVTIAATSAVIFGSQRYLIAPGTGSRFLIGAFILAVFSGVLLTVLFILTAYASFVQKMTKRVLVSICVVIITGIFSFGGAVGVVHYASMQRSYYIDANTRTQDIALPNTTNLINSIDVDTHGVKVEYYPTDGKPYAELHAVVKDQSDLPSVTTTVQGMTLRVTAVQKTGNICTTTLLWCNDTQPTLEIHAPTLTLITAEKDSMITYQPSEQSDLAIHAGENVSVDLLPGIVHTITATQGLSSVISLTEATVDTAEITTAASSNTDLGTVKTLSVQDNGSCPAPLGTARVDVWHITSGSMMINNSSQTPKTVNTGCTQINVEEAQ